LSFWNFQKCFWNENGWLWGGLFSEIYSLESSLYDFWILVILGGPFLGSFLSFWNFWKYFWNENVWLWGGLFSEIYSFERSLYDFWILVIFWGHFWVFEIFKNVFGSGLIRWFQRHLKILNPIIFGCLAAVLANVHVFFTLLCFSVRCFAFPRSPINSWKMFFHIFFKWPYLGLQMSYELFFVLESWFQDISYEQFENLNMSLEQFHKGW